MQCNCEHTSVSHFRKARSVDLKTNWLICAFFPLQLDLFCLPFNPFNPPFQFKSYFVVVVQFHHLLYSTGGQLNLRQCFLALTVKVLPVQTGA